MGHVKRLIASVLFIFLFSGISHGQQPAPSGPVTRIDVVGAQRVEAETVRSYMTVRVGDRASRSALDKSLKALFKTGLFADVALRLRGTVLVVTVSENPIINRLAFEGNKRISDDILSQEVQLRSRVVFTRSKVRADVQRILDLYRRSGRFAARVEPKIIKLPQNRVDLVFEVTEGRLTEVRSITFVGNKVFGDSTLRGVVQTKESAWYRIFASTDTYDPDRLTFDGELLRRHYLANGYADFRVASAIAELAPDREGFFITFTVEEGARYKLRRVSVSTPLRELRGKDLKAELTVESGDWYDADQVEESVGKLTELAGRYGYAFVDVRPDVRRDRKNGMVDITFTIREGPKVFVERININGNLRTLDKVIRREMLLVEGDAFNSSKLRRSRRRIGNLGYFEKVEIKNRRGSRPDQTVIDVEVKEQSTGEISFGAGYSSTAGFLGDIAIRERNLLGSGQDLRLGLQIGQLQQQIDLSFTEPYVFDRRISGGVDVFRSSRDLQDEVSFDRESLGFALRTGYRIVDSLRQNWRYTLREDRVTNVAATASLVVREQEGVAVTSAVRHGIAYDTRNNRFDPRSGWMVSMTTEYAGLGGDVNHLRNRSTNALYIPITDSVTGSIVLSGGYIYGLEGDEVRIIDRFFVGGNNLRGFSKAGIGPRDLLSGDSLGGNWFYTGTLEVGFPLGLPSEFGMRGRVFADMGNLGLNDDPPSGVSAVGVGGSIRSSVGIGLGWRTPMGPINIDYGRALQKEDFDRTETIRFSFGTRF